MNQRLKTLFHNHIVYSLFYGGIIGLISGLTVFIAILLIYRDFPYISKSNWIEMLLYLVGQYAGWLSISAGIFGLFFLVLHLTLPRIFNIASPRLFYFLLALFLQLFFWAEIVNFAVFNNYEAVRGARITPFIILGFTIAAFILFYKILRIFSIFRSPKNHPYSFSGIVIFVLVLILYSGSFYIPGSPKAGELNFENLRAEDNYDENGGMLPDFAFTKLKRYNILLLSIDTLGGDDLGCYSNDQPVSPFLDSLAQTGIMFENAYAVSPWTLPSHGTIFTSLYPTQHGAFKKMEKKGCYDVVSLSKPLIAEILKGFGYQTAAFTNGGWLSDRFNLQQGFDLFDYESEKEETFCRAVNFLTDYDDDEPFFLFLHTFLVHDYEPSVKNEIAFTDTTLKVKKKYIKFKHANRNHHNIAYFKRHPQYADYMKNLYDATIKDVDDYFREVYYALAEGKLLDQTIIIILSDHGEEFWEHGGTGHSRKYYEEYLKIPLIIILPPQYQLRNQVIEETVCLLDVAPTILDLIDAPELTSAEGVSLLPLIYGKSLGERQIFLESNSWENKVGVISAKYKYIYNKIPPIEKRILFSDRFPYPLVTIFHAAGEELYNLEEDPAEVDNLSANNPELTKRLRESTISSFNNRFSGYLLETKTRTSKIDEETLEKLRALGYVH